MVKVSAKTRAVLIASVLALCLSMSALAGVLYMIERNGTRLAEIESEMAHLVEEERSFKALETLEKETTADRMELEEYVLEQSEFVGFLSLLETTGAALSVAVATKSIQANPGAAGFETVVVTSELTGTFEALRSLIDLYEQLPYQLHIKQVSLDRTSEEGSEWRSSVTLEVTKATP